MVLKLKIAAAGQHTPVSQAWSSIVAHIRARRQRARDRRILARMSDHELRDIGLNHTGSFDRARAPKAL